MGGLGFRITHDTPIEDIVAKLKTWGIDYDAEWNAMYERLMTLQRKWGNCADAQVKADKENLQNYGRPTKDNHWKYAKNAGECSLFQ
eukprot:gene18589-30028_t